MLAKKKAVGLLVDFLKSIEVVARERGKKQELEWE